MALAKVIDGVTAVVNLAGATVFSPAGAFVVDAVGLGVGQYVIVNKLMSDGVYHPATDKNGTIVLSMFPNHVVIDAPGSYKLTKPTVTAAVTCGWEAI
jgi:hypothetical protein